MGFRYLVCDTLSRQKIGDFDLTGVTFGDPKDSAGQLTGTLSYDPLSPDIKSLTELISVDRACLYVVNGTQIPWHGPITQAPWNHTEQTLGIEAVQASSWLSTVLHGQARTPFVWTNKDQFQITRELVAWATSRPGAPIIKMDASVSGVPRDLLIQPQSFEPIDELINSMANRENGFDWRIGARFSSFDGLPEWYLEMFYPERQSLGGSTLLLEHLPTGGNILSRDQWPLDTSRRRTRVIALGEGEVPSQAQVYDEDPKLEDGLVLLREQVLGLNGRGITSNATLVEHARGARRAWSETIGTLNVEVGVDDPPLSDYVVGDRARLVIKDEHLNIDLPAVRIVDRSVADEDSQSVPRVTLTLDLSDTVSIEDSVPRGGYSNYQPESHDLLEWNEITSRIRRLEQRGVRIPIVGADPAANSGIGIWQLADGRIRWRLQDGSVQQAAVTTGSSTSAVPEFDPQDQTFRYTRTYAATWVDTYKGDGEVRDTTFAVWGDSGDGNGLQRAAIGLNFAAIQDDLFDATIVRVEVYLEPVFIQAKGGTYVMIGTHYASAEGADYDDIVPANLTLGSGFWRQGQPAWVNMPLSLGYLLKDGVARGILLSPKSSSRSMYGYASGWPGSGVRPHIRITYDK